MSGKLYLVEDLANAVLALTNAKVIANDSKLNSAPIAIDLAISALLTKIHDIIEGKDDGE